MARHVQVTLHFLHCKDCGKYPDFTFKKIIWGYRVIISCDCTTTARSFSTQEELEEIAEDWNATYGETHERSS